MLYAALRVPAEGPAVGVVRTGLPVALVDERIWELRGMVLIGAALAALVGLVLGLIFSRRLSAPVAAAVDAAVDLLDDVLCDICQPARREPAP